MIGEQNFQKPMSSLHTTPYPMFLIQKSILASNEYFLKIGLKPSEVLQSNLQKDIVQRRRIQHLSKCTMYINQLFDLEGNKQLKICRNYRICMNKKRLLIKRTSKNLLKLKICCMSHRTSGAILVTNFLKYLKIFTTYQKTQVQLKL